MMKDLPKTVGSLGGEPGKHRKDFRAVYLDLLDSRKVSVICASARSYLKVCIYQPSREYIEK